MLVLTLQEADAKTGLKMQEDLGRGGAPMREKWE